MGGEREKGKPLSLPRTTILSSHQRKKKGKGDYTIPTPVVWTNSQCISLFFNQQSGYYMDDYMMQPGQTLCWGLIK